MSKFNRLAQGDIRGSDKVLIDGGASAGGSYPVPVKTLAESFGAGVAIEARTDDLVANAENAGKMWMRTDLVNSTIKAVVASQAAAAGAWNAGGSLTTARHSPGGAGNVDDSICFGGFNATNLTTNERYNGAAWSSANPLSTARRFIGGAGLTGDDCLAFGGFGGADSAVTEEWDGVSFSGGGNLSTARQTFGSSGVSSASALAAGGRASAAAIASCEEYDGVAWSGVSSLGGAREANASFGTVSDTTTTGGDGTDTSSESFDGLSWSAGGTMNAAFYQHGASGENAGSGIVFGGEPNIATCERYDGATFVTVASLNTGRDYPASSGITNAALCAGGNQSSPTASVEEYSGAGGLEYTVETFSLS